MTKIQKVLATVICGFSAFSILPSFNYFRNIPPSADSVSSKAWLMTGNSMRYAIDKVGEKISVGNKK